MHRHLDQADPVSPRFSFRRLAASTVQTTTLLGCAAIVVGNIALGAYFDHQRERVLEETRTDARNLNTAFEQHIVRSIRNIDQFLLMARSEFTRDPEGFSVAQLASRDYFPKDIALQLAVIGPDGLMRASNLQSSGVVDLSDREHFRFHVGTAADELFISKPVLGRVSKLWSIQFTRKLFDSQGRFAGVIVASLDPYYLSRIYEAINIGTSGGVTLWGTDGIIRARGGSRPDVLGQSVAGSAVAEAVRSADAGVYEGVSILDGAQRIISFRRVPGYPLVVTVSIGREEALANFEASKSSLSRLMILVDLALGLIMALGVVEAYRLNMMRERLKRRAAMLSSTFANMHEGILMVNGQGQVVAINDRALEFMGLSPGSIALPAPYADLPLARRETDAPEEDPKEISLAEGRTLEIRTSLMPDGAFVKTLTDVTARKQDQAVLEEARDRAEAASRARTSFLATMSHEIRTPLGGILSMVDLIGGTDLDAAQRRYVEITRDSAEHLLQLIDDVLDVTKLDAEQVRFENIAFDLFRQIRSTLDIVSAKAQEKGLSIGCVIAPDVPREMTGDPGRLRQVLINLLGNAIKFTSQGHVLLEVTRKRDAGGDKLCVRVEDTGIGIARESIPNLFRDFSQIDSTISRRFGGTGLGLAISRKLITRMGGTIGVESEPGSGSVFFFDLPMGSFREPAISVAHDAILAIVAANPFERSVLERQTKACFGQVRAFDGIEAARDWLSTTDGDRRILLVEASLAPQSGLQGLAQHSIEAVLLCARQDFLAAERAAVQAYAGVLHKPMFPDALRQALSRKAPPPQPERGAARSDCVSPLGGKLQGVRVLIAEDNPTNQFALRRMLEMMGALVTAASNGWEAVEHAAREPFDIVFMDVMMPELDGLAATRAIRGGGGPNAATPIIALTASAFVEDRDAALAAGMTSFATKPITGQQLLDAATARRPGKKENADRGLPGLDRKMLDQLREDLGPEHMRAALDIFFKDLRQRAELLRAADGSADVLRKEAHAIKGSAASFGFRRVAGAAEKLEAAARRNETQSFASLLSDLLAEADAAPALLPVAA